DRCGGGKDAARAGYPEAVRGQAAADDILRSVHVRRRSQPLHPDDAGTSQCGRRCGLHSEFGRHSEILIDEHRERPGAMPPGALFLRFPFSPGGIDWSRGGMCMKRTVAVVGGDMRQVRLAELLLNDGWLVCTWGLDQGGGPNAVPLDQALGAELLILPLPVCRGGGLTLPLTDTALGAEQLWPRLRYDQLLLGGM